MAETRKSEGIFSRENIITVDEDKHPHLVNWTKNKHVVINNNALSFSNDYYWYYYWGSARGSVRVGRGGEASLSSGCWYYEVTIKESGTCRIGWALPTFNPGESTEVKIGDGGDSWGVDGHSQKKYHAQKEEPCTVNWASGGVVGTMVDFSTNKIFYSVNGGPLQSVFTHVLAHELYPCISLQSRAKIEINFGPKFQHCPPGAFGLNPHLTKRDTTHLEKLFDKYKDAETGAISGRSLLTLLRDMGANAGNHPLLGVVPWRINAGKFLTLTYDEWMCSWALAQVFDFEGMKRVSQEWIRETETDDRCFSNYYNYTFRYLKNANAGLSSAEAIKGWHLTGVSKKWKFWDLWEKFIVEKNIQITWSVWDQFLPFIKTIGSDPKNFDENDMWPLLMEEFFEAKLKNL
jgi:hypothetical protein